MDGNAAQTGPVQVFRHGGTAVLVVTGEIDIATVGPMRTMLHELLDERTAWIVVDLEEVDFFGSSGISTLVDAVHRADRLGVRLSVATSRHAVLRGLEITRTDELLTVYGSVVEALGTAVPPPRDDVGARPMPGVR
jgi:anti-anti-sigma factor